MTSPAMDTLNTQLDAQARKTTIRETKLGARRFLTIPQNSAWMADGHLPVALETINRWFGFGGETKLLRMRSARLYMRYRRLLAYHDSHRNVA